MVNDVPITVPMPISKIVLVPIGHSATSTLPLMLSMLAPIKAPARGAAGIPVFRAKAPKIPPGAAPRIVVMISILSNLLVHNPIANPVITKVKVINMAGFHKF